MTRLVDFDPRGANILNGAVSQFDRIRAAPKPAAVSVDGRSIAQLLAFGARYGALVRFYDLTDLENGDWSAFFALDPAVASAVRGALDLPEIELALRLTLANARAAREQDERERHVHHAKHVMILLIFILDESFPDRDADADVDIQLAALATVERRDGIGAPLRDWHHHHRRRSRDEDRDWHHRHLDLLEDLLAALIAELDRGAAAALAAVDTSLGSQGHAPQAALWNAFVMLFAETRQEMNRFPQRLLDFFYGDILQQDHREARPDEVFLTFTLAQGATEASVPKGALFVAGTDPDGNPIYYAATSSLAVEAASVTSVGVHRITYLRGGIADDHMPKGVLSGIVSLPPAGSPDVMPFPLFGSVRPGTFGGLTMIPASLGFIVESPTLLLSGGNRSVRITLAPSRSTPARVSAVNETEPTNLLAVTGDTGQGATPPALATTMTLAFELFYSTAGGWMKVDDLSVVTRDDSSGIPEAVVFSFTLPAGAPPLEPASAKPTPGGPTPTLPMSAYPDLTDQPTVVATLLYESKAASDAAGDTPISMSTYALLSKMKVTSIAVDVSVDTFVPPLLSSPNGPIDPSQNFALFGLAPAQYAAFEFAAPEFFVKRLTRLSATIGWVGLPVTTTGFLGYYQGYRLNADGVLSDGPLFDNTTFRVSYSVVAPGLWTLGSSAPLYLFQTPDSSTAGDGPGPDPATTVSQNSLLAAPCVEPNTPPNYYNPALSTLRLSLVEPSYAFGNILYASNLLAASTANAATMQTDATSVSSAKAQIALAGSVNATAPSGKYHDHAGQAVHRVISALNGQVFQTLQKVLANGAATDGLQGLQAAIGEQPGGGALLSRLKSWIKPPDENAITANLRDWMAAHEADFANAGGAAWTQADTTLSAAETLAAEWKATAGKTVAVARPKLAAALGQAQSMVAAPTSQASAAASTSPLPNQPWLPTASSFTVSYDAAGNVAFTSDEALALPTDATDGARAPVDPDESRFLHLGPFGTVTAAVTPDVAPELSGAAAQTLSAAGSLVAGALLLPKVGGHAAFYIDLSASVAQISLLFVLTAGPDGWSSGPSTLTWQKKVGRRWKTIGVVSDSTNGLRNSGVVALQVAASEHDHSARSLRAILGEGEQNAAYVTSITANALTAVWVGPGGSATLGQPLAPGTIKQSKNSLEGIASIAQPMQSVGGAPPSVGAPFQMWMAERLRHKGFAIDAWDYAQIALDAVPSLWQLAVVPAVDEATGRMAPGHVWLVAVAGWLMPNISDPTVPAVDPGILAEIGELLSSVASPFAKLTVTNPPYLRLTVHAKLVFSDADTPGFWIEKLQADLIKWLSPWPDPAIGPRPADYYTRQAIAEFVRQRSYVLGITSLHVVPERDPAQGGWHYFTSALSHHLTSSTPASTPTARMDRPREQRRSLATAPIDPR